MRKLNYFFHCQEYLAADKIFVFITDKVHTLSSERDHARATFKAHTDASRIVSLLFLMKIKLNKKYFEDYLY